MNIFYSSLVYSAILCSSIAADVREEIEATFNIDETEDGNFENLRDDDPVNVLMRTKSGKGASAMVFPMSLRVNMEIERAGIIGATVSRKDMEHLQNNKYIDVELDRTIQVLGDPVGNLRDLSEDTPYGIAMVLQDMEFWSKLTEPSGEIKVCVADTGYDRGHVDLPDGDDVTGTNNPNYIDNWYEDGHGHGTHCSGTIAGTGGNDEGVIGVIPNNAGGKFQLVIGNALSGDGSGTGGGLLKAIDTCVANGAKIISLSLGGGGYSAITDSYYTDLYENQGILFVAAAGNSGNDALGYPASYPALMSVAAIDSSKNTASFSQYNDQVEISAPGVFIKSSIPDNEYVSWSGTSMATPHVAGVAGLIWMHFPDCTNYEIRNVLAATAEDLNANGCDDNTGYGLVQAKSAYEMLSKGGCGGNIGQISPVGGCEQLVPVSPTPAPTPNCASDDECDGGNACSVYTCDNGLCQATLKCDLCGKTNLQLDIRTDKYGAETSYNIKDASNNKVMEGSGYESYKDYSDLICLYSGSYTFTIYDTWGDGMCCTLGEGSYSVKVSDGEVASGGDFAKSEEKVFSINPAIPTTPTPVQIPAPSTSPPTTPPTPFPTETQPTPFPVNTPLTPLPTDSPPTPFPTDTRPSSYPTGSAPTPFPTQIPPTSYPTDSPPTPFPTQTPPTKAPACKDSTSFNIKPNKSKNCKYVKKMIKKKGMKFCNKKLKPFKQAKLKIKDVCPVTCKSCD